MQVDTVATFGYVMQMRWVREVVALFTSTWAIPALLVGIIACMVLIGLGIAYVPAQIALRVCMAGSAFFMLRFAKRRGHL